MENQLTVRQQQPSGDVKNMKTKQQEEEEAPSIYGDVLEAILSHVPLTDLVFLSHVSKSWNLSVASSLHYCNGLKPWLLVHTQTSRPPYATTTHGYDPRTDNWIQFDSPSIKYVSVLRSSHSDLLYMLSPWGFSYSIDALHLTWHHVTAPLVWRTDPIVAVVGNRIVVAGGTCGFEDDLLAVEIYNIESATWTKSESMPSLLNDSAASTWLSVAVDNQNQKLFVGEKHSGITYAFDPETMIWSEPYELRPDSRIFYSVIAFTDDRLIVTGLLGQPENVIGVKIYEVNTQTFECLEITEMPILLVKKLKSDVFEISSIRICTAGNLVYIYNPAEIGEVFICELDDGGFRWRSVRNVVSDDRSKMGRTVFTCCKVTTEDLKKAIRSEKWKFLIKH